MDRKIRFALVGLGAVTAVATVVAGLKYVFSADHQTGWGLRVARRLGIKPASFGASYSTEQVLQRLEEPEFSGLLHLRLLMLSGEERKKALANFNTNCTEVGLDPVTDDDLARFTEELRQAAMERLSAEERRELLKSLNEHRASLDLEPIAEDAFSTPVTD